MTSPSCSSFQSPITTNGSSSLVWEDIPLDSECVVNQDDKSTKRNVNCYVNYDEVNNNWNRNNHFVKDENDLDDDDDEDDDDTLYFEESASEYRTPPGSPKLFYSSDETINKSLYQHSDSFHGQSSLPLGNHFRSNSIGGCNESLKLSYRKKGRTGSLVDQLLNDIHFTLRKTDHRRTSRCSDTSSLSPPDFTYRLPHIRKANLLAKDISELQVLLSTLECDIKRMNSILLHHLKKKDRLHFQRGQLFDIITAALQAISPKRRVDTKMRFSIEPSPGDSGFNQWHDAMRMVARLPGGIPNEFRKKLWLTLSERFIESRNINWSKTSKFCFNEKCNPEDDSLGTQIVKDLHRTGCSMFSGADSEHNQALLKQVLLAYARWNRGVGYCQGFNMLAAIILEVMDWDVDNSLKVMIYLIEGVLPTSYFANNLRGLSVDMATFRDLLRLRLPELSKHLDKLQNQAADTSTGASYEPPLVNVFTMQWFLTLFSNCLPKPLVLRIWDLIFLEGNEILIRTALVIWDCLQDRIINVESADEFYSIMGVLTREMMEFGVRDTNELVKTICTMAPFPFPQLADIREKYTFNIRPLTSLVKKGVNLFYSDEEEDDSTTDTIMVASWCLSNGLTNEKSRERSGSRATSPSTLDGFSNSLSMIGSTIGSNSTNFLSSANIDPQRMSLDISLLKKQYMKLKERQRQAHIILIEGFQNAQSNSVTKKQSMTVNHLLQGKTALIAKRPRKPCSVRQPTIGSAIGVGIIGGGRSTVVTGTNNVGRCPVSKKCLSERSKTVADLDPLLKSAKVTLEEKGKESGETLHWNDLRIERKKNRITRKLSEPSLSVCREHEESEFPEDEEDEESNEPEVAFIGYSSSAKLNSKANRRVRKSTKPLNGSKRENSLDSDDHDDEDQVMSSSSSDISSSSILSSDSDSSSTELCDEIDDDDEDNVNHNCDVDSLPDDNENHNNNNGETVDHLINNPLGVNNSKCSRKLIKHKKRNETQSKTGNGIDKESDNQISAKNCLNNTVNHHHHHHHHRVKKISDKKVINLPNGDEKQLVNHQQLNNLSQVEINLITNGDDSIDDIKRQLSDLSVEQCIQKLNEKISSLSSD